MLTVGDKFPALTLPVQQGTSALPAGETIDLGDTDGKWKVLFYWPKDFTFVCPTEIIGYGESQGRFRRSRRRADRRLDRHRFRPLRLAQVGRAARRTAISPGSPTTRRNWPTRSASSRRTRASRFAPPSSSIRTTSSSTSRSTASTVGRNPQETLRVLDALQTDELCPCNWQPGRRGAEARRLTSGPGETRLSGRGEHRLRAPFLNAEDLTPMSLKALRRHACPIMPRICGSTSRSLLGDQALSDQRKYGLLLACAHGSGYQPLVDAAEAEAAEQAVAGGRQCRSRGGGGDGDEQCLLSLRPPRLEP